MASPELEDDSKIAKEEVDDGRSSKKVDSSEIKHSDRDKKMKMKKKKSKRGSFGCFGLKSELDEKGSLEMEVEDRFRRRKPTHLIIMVNGLIGRYWYWYCFHF